MQPAPSSTLRSAMRADFAAACANQGAAAFAGYTDYIGGLFAVSCGVRMFTHLAGAGDIRTIPPGYRHH